MTTDPTGEPQLFASNEITSNRPGTPQEASGPPASRTKAKAVRAAARAITAKQRRDPSATAIVVAASAVTLHPALGIDAGAFAQAHTALVDGLVEDLRRGAPDGGRLQVVRDGARYLAVDQVELVVAAGLAAVRSPDLTLPVLLVDAVDPARLVRDQLTGQRGKSGWEQYRVLDGVFAGQRVRDVLRDLDLKLSWESTVSRVLKVGLLDPSVLETVDPFTIPVKEAGQLVDAWKDEARRDAMTTLLAGLRGASNQRLDAKACFATLLAVGRPEVVAPAWVEGDDGRRDYVAANGAVLATVSLAGGRWIAEGTAMATAQWQAFVKRMPRPGQDR